MYGLLILKTIDTLKNDTKKWLIGSDWFGITGIIVLLTLPLLSCY